MQNNVPSLRDRQLELEAESTSLGIARYEKARENSDEADTGPGRRLVMQAVAATGQAIRAFVEEAKKGGGGRPRVPSTGNLAMKLSRQANLIVEHLYNNEHITSWQAEGVYRIRRLASRVTELVRAGYDIRKERCEDATGQSYTRYSFTRPQRRRGTPLNTPTAEQPRFLLDRVIDLYRAYCSKELNMGGDDVETEAADFRRFIREAK